MSSTVNQTKFKADPYNFSNHLVTSQDVIHILQKLNMKLHPSKISLYQQAFVHKSYNYLDDYKEYKCPEGCLSLQPVSYETLEFLGDSLLGCMTAEYLYERFEGENEGFMTKLKTRIVNGEQLCYLATQLGMNQYLIISKHIEEKCDGRNNQHILEDVLEAFIGALYLDTRDYTIIQEFVFQLIETFLDLPEIILNDTNYKEQILKYCQHNFKVYPTYRHLDEKSDGDELFQCEILKDGEVMCKGSGKTKKKAEQNASYNALLQLNVLN